jgi:hypothetical protein
MGTYGERAAGPGFEGWVRRDALKFIIGRR